MHIMDVPFAAIDWARVPETQHQGARGSVVTRTVEVGNIRARIVNYSEGYESDHWCSRGHVVFVLEGTLITEVGGGVPVRLTPRMMYHVAEGQPHRSRTESGACLFIVD